MLMLHVLVYPGAELMVADRRLGHARRGTPPTTTGLGSLDRALFDAVATSSTPFLDKAMPPLTSAANHSKLWLAIAVGLWLSGKPSAQRGAARGVMSLAVSSLVTNQGAKRLWPRARPAMDAVPVLRRLVHRPTSNSMPSGHAASAAAFAVGVGLENPTLGLLLGGLAGLVGLSRVATGAHYPGDVLAGFGIGASIAMLLGQLFRPIVPEKTLAAEPLQESRPACPDGAGVVLVINPASGSGTGARVVDEVREQLPGAEIVTLSRDDDLDQVLRSAAERAEVLGIGGGDGTVSAAAAIAVQTGKALAVFPAGTFNHFAKDIGCPTVAATVAAIRAGTVQYVDLVYLNDNTPVINTASIGSYPQFVRTRESVERKIGKPLASVYATLHTMRHRKAVRIRYDNKTLLTSLFFLGNSIYYNSGFNPAQRRRLDDGLLDVRILEIGPRFSRLRVMTALITGRLERSALYHELRVPEFTFTVVEGQAVVTHDGELGTDCQTAHFKNQYRILPVFRPLR
jgi:diacylglycerol kinase family enzyme/membrane-associated phospholipid phosphatase